MADLRLLFISTNGYVSRHYRGIMITVFWGLIILKVTTTVSEEPATYVFSSGRSILRIDTPCSTKTLVLNKLHEVTS
jgi:hypothetical protein